MDIITEGRIVYKAHAALLAELTALRGQYLPRATAQALYQRLFRATAGTCIPGTLAYWLTDAEVALENPDHAWVADVQRAFPGLSRPQVLAKVRQAQTCCLKLEQQLQAMKMRLDDLFDLELQKGWDA